MKLSTSALDRFNWVALLLGRLATGLLFLSAGWGKVHDLGKVTEFFSSLGIPFPGFNAVLVGYSEMLCGFALVVGLLTRLAALPLVVSMAVAIFTARADDVSGLFDLIGLEEFTYLSVLMMLVILGPGRASLDHLLARHFAPNGKISA
jgi:putative oxidoreductase